MLKHEIGETAGKLWSALGKKERVSLADVHRLVNTDSNTAHQAVGWLAREEKIKFEKEGRATYISLTNTEIENYKKANSDK